VCRKSLIIKHLGGAGGRRRVSRWYSSTYVTLKPNGKGRRRNLTL